MAFARTLFMLLGALGVLLLGAVAPALADSAPPPCHEMAAPEQGDTAPRPDKPMKSMGCCVACIAAPAITPPDRSGVAMRPVSLAPASSALPVGRRLTPETGPPRA